jgi:hypothetical protein
MKAEADRQFLQGVNQLVGHGWPYSPPAAGSPGWRFYAAAALSDKNPWWIAMPDVARALQRTSAMLRQGTPVADVALYLPVDDAWADFSPGNVHLIEVLQKRIGPDVIPSILDAGFNFDFVDAASLAKATVQGNSLAVGAGRYRAVVVPHAIRIPAHVQRLFDELTTGGGFVVVGEKDAGAAIAEHVSPDVLVKSDQPPRSALGVVHRRVGARDVYFVANTSNMSSRVVLSFRTSDRTADWWDPVTASRSPVRVFTSDDRAAVPVALPPYTSGFVVFETPAGPAGSDVVGVEATYSSARFSLGTSAPNEVALPHSWTAASQTVHVSGVGRYELDAEGPHSPAEASDGAWLEFGDGHAIPPDNPPKNGMQAWFEAPVRDVAVVYVNGVRAGAAWCPPYRVSLGSMLHPGKNTIRIDVANTAMNVMAGTTLPDYKLLNLRYGTRFEPQDMDRVAPQPSGLLTPHVVIRWSRTQ